MTETKPDTQTRGLLDDMARIHGIPLDVAELIWRLGYVQGAADSTSNALRIMTAPNT